MLFVIKTPLFCRIQDVGDTYGFTHLLSERTFLRKHNPMLFFCSAKTNKSGSSDIFRSSSTHLKEVRRPTLEVGRWYNTESRKNHHRVLEGFFWCNIGMQDLAKGEASDKRITLSSILFLGICTSVSFLDGSLWKSENW